MTCDANKPSGVVGLSLGSANIYADLFSAVNVLTPLFSLKAVNLSLNSLYGVVRGGLQSRARARCRGRPPLRLSLLMTTPSPPPPPSPSLFSHSARSPSPSRSCRR